MLLSSPSLPPFKPPTLQPHMHISLQTHLSLPPLFNLTPTFPFKHPPSLSAASANSSMEEYYYRRSQVPAFGSWDWDDNLPFTQCFESATQAGFFRYTTFSDHSSHHDDHSDLYVAGDLYQNDVVTPAMIVVPRRPKTKVRERRAKGEEGEKQKWVNEYEEGGRSTKTTNITMGRPTAKPVDEDLYRISPELLYHKHTKKSRLSFFSSCLLPTCIA